MLFLVIEKGNHQACNIKTVIRDQLQGKHITKFTKLYTDLHASLYHQHTNQTKICFNDDALIALLPKVVCFVRYVFVVYVIILLCDQLVRKTFRPICLTGTAINHVLLSLFENTLNHVIFVSLLYAYRYCWETGGYHRRAPIVRAIMHLGASNTYRCKCQ